MRHSAPFDYAGDHAQFVRTVRELLAFRGMSQRELCRRVGLSHCACAHWLTQGKWPRAMRLSDLCRALGCTPTFLLSYRPSSKDLEGMPAARLRRTG